MGRSVAREVELRAILTSLKDATLVSLTIMGLTVTDEADTDSSVAIVGLQKGRGMVRLFAEIFSFRLSDVSCRIGNPILSSISSSLLSTYHILRRRKPGRMLLCGIYW